MAAGPGGGQRRDGHRRPGALAAWLPGAFDYYVLVAIPAAFLAAAPP